MGKDGRHRGAACRWCLRVASGEDPMEHSGVAFGIRSELEVTVSGVHHWAP